MPPLNQQKATAKVSVSGLAISCYNPQTYNWEVGLIRQPPHVLRITVVKFADAENSSQMAFNIDDKHNIYVTAANAVLPEEPLYKKEPFDRKHPETSDREDFRWIVDFENEFNNGQPVTVTKPENVAITELYVSSPLLYADKLDQLDDLELLNIATGEKTEFGTLSQQCHGDITCNEGGTVMLCIDGPLGFSVDLPHIEGVTHRILIENLCPEGLEGFTSPTGEPRTDFNHYFSLITLPGDVTFDVGSAEGEFGSDAVCNPGYLGGRGKLLPIG